MARPFEASVAGRPLFSGRVDERTNESSTDTAIGHRTEAALYRRPSVPRAAQVTLAARSWRALDHLGRVPRRHRHGARGVARPSEKPAITRERSVDADRGAPNSSSVVDTNGMIAAYDVRSSVDCRTAMPNTSSRR
jgi:hypothetical protein